MNGLMNLTIKAKLILLVLVTLVGMSFITISTASPKNKS